MLIRRKDPVFPSSGPDSFDLTEALQSLMDALRDGADPRITTQMLQKALTASEHAERHLQEQGREIAALERDAVTDPLTGVLNRRGFEVELRRALAEGHRYGEQGALLYLDLDGFKQVNDTLGHAAGDAVLCKFASILTNNVRGTDRVGRLGGDEFTILMSRTSLEDARTRAETIEWAINTTTFEWNGQAVSIQASLGADYFGPNDDRIGIILRADQDMYRRKQERRKTPRPDFRADGIPIPISPMVRQC